MIDLSLNRVYWEYTQNNSYLRPDKFISSQTIPSIGVRATVPVYNRRGTSFHNDLTILVKEFAKKYNYKYRFVLALSGGIDSEVTAETFYQLGIPFRAVSQQLFDGTNNHDIVCAVKYCKDRNITHKVINLSMDRMLDKIIPEGVKHGQFTHSYSQIALTNLFHYVEEDEILIFSGHNPDFHHEIGIGWWEDSPNIIKYAISTNKLFFTFTSLEPIFCHYAANYDGSQPGDKDNTFLYNAFPHLRLRIKQTGWEKNNKIIPDLEDAIREQAAYKYQSFITWDQFTLKYIRKLFIQQKGLTL
jgi:hypothetical protein